MGYRLSLWSVLPVFLAAGQYCQAQSAERPNFVIISIDDLGYADIGPYGSTLNRTPNLDRMAAEGRRLTCFYAAPVCSPSRSALMTGCYPKRVLPIPGVLFPGAAVGVSPDEVTVAEVLKGVGYRTACIGKWHLGDQSPFLPTAQGFDYYLGIPYSNDMGTAAEGSKSDLGAEIPQPKAPAAGKKGTNGVPSAQPAETGITGNQQPPLPLVENTRVIGRVAQDEQQAIVETYTRAAVRFIQDNREQPFLRISLTTRYTFLCIREKRLWDDPERDCTATGLKKWMTVSERYCPHCVR